MLRFDHMDRDNCAECERAKSLIRLFMPEPQDDTEELHSDGADSEDVEINRDLFKDIAFFLHKSIKKNFSRRNLTRDIEVRCEAFGPHNY
jgi:hypothetical protein